jgi:hypothetical protein
LKEGRKEGGRKEGVKEDGKKGEERKERKKRKTKARAICFDKCGYIWTLLTQILVLFCLYFEAGSST